MQRSSTHAGWFIYLAQSIHLLFSLCVKQNKRMDDKAGPTDWRLSAKPRRCMTTQPGSCFDRTTLYHTCDVLSFAERSSDEDEAASSGWKPHSALWNNRYGETGSKIQGHGGHFFLPCLPSVLLGCYSLGFRTLWGWNKAGGHCSYFKMEWGKKKNKSPISLAGLSFLLQSARLKGHISLRPPRNTSCRLDLKFYFPPACK